MNYRFFLIKCFRYSILNALVLFFLLPARAQENPNQPYSTDKWYDAAVQLYDAGNYSLALKLLKMAIAKDSTKGHFWILQGDCNQSIGNQSLAMLDYGKAIQLNSQDACTMYKLAGLYADIGDSDATLATLDQAIRVNPNMPEYYNLRGEVNFKQKKWEAAIADFSRAIQLDPKQRRYWINRADAYNAINKIDAAKSDYTKALHIE